MKVIIFIIIIVVLNLTNIFMKSSLKIWDLTALNKIPYELKFTKHTLKFFLYDSWILRLK